MRRGFRVRGREVAMEDMDMFDEELRGAMRNTAPPADFAARTVRRAGKTEIGPAGVRPVVWGALAAAACLLLAVIAGQGVQDRSPSGATAMQEDTVAVAPAQSHTVGPAFVAEGGEITPYRGRTNVKIVWNLSQNAPELVVEAFPWED